MNNTAPYSQLRIFVECHPNAEIRDFHLSQPTFFKPFDKYDDEGIPKKIQAWERRLSMLPQLQTDSISNIVGLKSLRIKLNPAYTWDECIEAVVAEINRYFKCEALPLVTIMERDPEWDRPRPERETEDMY